MTLLFTKDLVPTSDRDLPAQIADLQERIARHRAQFPTDADEVVRLVNLADDLRSPTRRPSTATVGVSREDVAEIDRLADLARSLRGSPTEGSQPGRALDPADQAEIDRLAALAKESR